MGKLVDTRLIEQLMLHQEWLESLGNTGCQLWLENGDLAGLDLSGRNLSQAILPGVKFDGAFLRQTDFYSSNLASASFSNADLTEATLTKANLDYASLINTVLQGAKAFKTSFVEVDMHGADLTGADLSGTYFVDANLEHAILCNANLNRATLEGVRLFGTDLRGVKGLDTFSAQWIDIGPREASVRLEGNELRNWLIRAGKGEIH